MSPSEPVRVTVRRSGGVTGITRAWTANTADLPVAAADELRHLVAAGEPFLGSAPLLAHPGLPDAFTYEVAVTDAAGLRRAAVDSSTAPPALRALLEWVLAAGRIGPT